MRFELKMAIRHLRAGGSQTVLIVGGVAVAVTLVIFVNGLIRGVQKELTDRITGSLPHVTVEAPEMVPRRPVDMAQRYPDAAVAWDVQKRPHQRDTIDDWCDAARELQQLPHVRAVSPGVTGQAILSSAGKEVGVRVQGAIPEWYDQVVNISDDLLYGTFLTMGTDDVIIGYKLQEELGVELGERVRISTGFARDDTLRVAGIIETGQDSIDEGWAFVQLRTAQSIFETSTSVTQFAITLDKLFAADGVADRIDRSLGLDAESWSQQNPNFVNALRAQSSSNFMISAFSLIAAAFAIASVLIVSVLKRSSEIGILKAMGASSRQILTIFTLEGLGIALVGTALGAAAGTTLILLLRQIPEPVSVPGQTPEPLLPTMITPGIVLGTMLVAGIITVAASVWPARRAAQMDP
ncbi:MAG: ABC transporter permease, partial [Armatimonadota bacterium]